MTITYEELSKHPIMDRPAILYAAFAEILPRQPELVGEQSALEAITAMRQINFADSEHGKSFGAGFEAAIDEFQYRLTGTHSDACDEHEHVEVDCAVCLGALGALLDEAVISATAPADLANTRWWSPLTRLQ